MVFAAASLFVAAQAWGANRPKVAIVVEGPNRDAARAEVRQALAAEYSPEDPRAVLAALAREGHKGPLAPALADDKKRAALTARLQRAARAAHVDEVVVVAVAREGRTGRRARVLAVDAERHTASNTRTSFVPGDGALGAAVRGELHNVHPADTAAASSTSSPDDPSSPASSSSSSSSPAPPEPEPSSDPSASISASSDADRPTSAPSRERERGHELISAEVGVEAGGRHFRYVDGLSQNLRRYNLTAAPLVGVSVGVYPLAWLDSPIDAGIIGGYTRAFGVSSSGAGADSLGTQWWRFHVGVRGRLRATPALVVGASAVYGGEAFTFESAPAPLQNESPSVSYRYIRAGLDARVALGRFSVSAAAGYDFVLSAGSVADRFPHANVGGVEVSLGPSFAITRAWEVGATASYRRFFYAMHPVPGDALVAGGAVDELYGLQGSLRYAF
jgi:hypothetical protein